MGRARSAPVANRLGALALTLGDAVREATEEATGFGGGVPAALVSLREWADGASVDVLAGAMHLSHSRAVRVVDRLEEAGLARREPDPNDGRRALVRLQPAGRRLADRALQARSRLLETLTSALTSSQLVELEGVLAVLLDATTVDAGAAMRTCRLCDTHGCGHFDGACPVTQAADRHRASA